MPIPTQAPTNQQPAINFQLFLKIAFIVCCTSSVVAAYLFYELYWKWRACFNDAGDCFVEAEEIVYSEQSGIFWGGLTLTLFCLSVFLAYKSRK